MCAKTQNNGSERTSKRIWIISELYYPEETSTGYLLTQIAEGLARQFSVNVLCSQPTYGARGQRALWNEIKNDVNIYRCWGTTFNKDILPLRIINMVTITLSIMINALRRIGPKDFVLVVTNPPLLPFAISAASFFRRFKSILVVHDVYPEALMVVNGTQPGTLFNRLVAYLTRILYRHMKRIVVLGRDMALLVRGKLPAEYQSIVIIPNWADIDLIFPGSRCDNLLLTEINLMNKFVIQYAGNMGRTHGIEYLARCAEKLKGDSDTHFLFIGSGVKKKWLKHAVNARGLSNITILDKRPRSDQLNFLNACDVAVISFMPNMAGVSVPSRMYNVMAAGKPMIAVTDPDSELALVVREEDIGWVVSPGDIDGLRMAILEAKADPNLLVQMGKRARQAAETKYSFERANKAYTEMLTFITEKT
jgi:colanic acid biosynthesis glycosyl transferase WcaI